MWWLGQIRSQAAGCALQEPFGTDVVAAQPVRASDRELGQGLPHASLRRAAGRLPRVLKDFVGVEWATGIKQTLRLVERLLGCPRDTFGLPRNTGLPVWQGATQLVAGSCAVRATRPIPVAIHLVSVAAARSGLARPCWDRGNTGIYGWTRYSPHGRRR
jgi:hypothetical protein